MSKNEEISIEQQMLIYVTGQSKSNDIDDLLNVFDNYCWNNQWMMNLGDIKGKILDQQLLKYKPQTVLEFGTYCGYSSTRIVKSLSKSAKFITIEMNPYNANIAASIHKHANVSERIIQLVADTKDAIPTLSQEHDVKQGFDLIFIDHWKNVYLRDLKLLEQFGLIRKGTVVVADNMIYPGAPDYLEYTKTCGHYENELFESFLEYQYEQKDAVLVSVRK